MATPPSPPILGMYETNGAFPTPGPSAWPSGSTTNLSATYLAFDADWATYAAPFVAKCNNNGLIPFVELEPWHYDQSAVPFTDITGGAWDTYLEAIGTGIANSGHPVILTFAHEMNVSGQYPWAQGDTGSGPSGGTLTPAEWITGWKYVHDKVNSTANGLAIWMWACSAYTGGTTVSPAPWWPGASYVDMVGIDGYPNTQYGAALGTFAGQIQPTVTIIRDLGWTDPIYISETNLAQMVASGGESISKFVADMAAAGVSGVLEFEDASWNLPQMTAAQWTEYNNAIAANFGTSSGGGSGGGSGGAGTGTLTVTKGTADEVSATSGVAHSVTSISPSAGSMVRWCAAWLNSNDTLGLTFTAKDSTGVSYGAPTLKGNPGDGDGGCYLLIWDHVYNAAPGPITLTITASGSGVATAAPSDCLILPYVITGQAADQSTAAFNDFSEAGTSTTTYEIALNTTASGSVVFVLGAPNHNGGATGPVTAISGTTTDVDWDDANVGSRGTFGRSTNPTATPGATTFGWTSANPSPNGYGVMAAEVIPASPGSGGGTTSGSSAGTTFSAVGPYIETTGTSFSWTPAKVGNTLVLIALSKTAGAPVYGVSSTNATWAQVVPDQTLGSSTITEATAFLGTATKPSLATVNLATTATAGNLLVLAREFDSSGLPVALDLFVTMSGDATGNVTEWPSISPTKGGDELLFGFERNYANSTGGAVAGSTVNTAYYVDANKNGAAYDLSVSAPAVVSWGDIDARSALVLLLYAQSSGSSGGGTSGNTNGNTFWYDNAVITGLNAKAALLNGGTLQLYTGPQPALNGALTGTLLVTLTFGATAFASALASGGIATAAANAITAGDAVASGTPGYFALVTAGGQTVLTGTVGDGSVSGVDLVVPGLAIASGSSVACSAFSLTQSETGN